MPSPPAAHRCAIIGRRTDRWVISNTPSMFMIGKDTPALNPAAPARCVGSYRSDVLHSIAPPARSNLSRSSPAQTRSESFQGVDVVGKLLYKPPRLRWLMAAHLFLRRRLAHLC